VLLSELEAIISGYHREASKSRGKTWLEDRSCKIEPIIIGACREVTSRYLRSPMVLAHFFEFPTDVRRT
jgi:hypothetical protein